MVRLPDPMVRLRDWIAARGRRRRRCVRAFTAFGGSRDGVAIVEFALIVPFLLVLYSGTVELSNVLRNARKVDVLARTLADLVSQRTDLSTRDIAEIFRSARIILFPYDSDAIKITVSAVGVSALAVTGPLQVCSSTGAPGSPVRTPGAAAPVDEADSIQAGGTRLVLVEVTASYRPVLGALFFKEAAAGFPLSRKTLWPIRYGRRYFSQSPEIVLPLGAPCPHA